MPLVVITDTNVARLYGKELKGRVFAFPAGEKFKTRATKEKLENALLKAGFLRDTTIIGLGGGVVCDMAGFLAATYCRGVRLILVPTTLMAMVDASIGGKNGLNTSQGKNLIGTIYHPEKVVINLDFLKTLPEHEMRCGLVEMFKHAFIADEGLLESMDVRRAIEVKRRIVARDAKERGLRRVLNFGHTIGHAIERLSDYKTSHGDAVAIGMVVEAALAYEMGVLEMASWQKITSILGPLHLPYSAEAIMQTLAWDKKSQGNLPRFVMLKSIGHPHPFDGDYCTAVPENLLKRVLHDFALCARPAITAS